EIASVETYELTQRRRRTEHPIARPDARSTLRDVEILPDRQAGKDPTVFRKEADAGARDAVGLPARDVDAPERDAPRLRRREPHDRPHRGGLADTVAAEQAHALAGVDLDRDAEQHARQAVRRVDVAHLEQRRAHRVATP